MVTSRLSPGFDDPFTDQAQSDPQSWNLYGYVRNNPLSNTDATGNYCISVNGGVSYHDDNQGGQTCAQAEAQGPAAYEVWANAGSAPGAFVLNFLVELSNQANDFFRPVTNAMGIQPSYMQNTPTGSGDAATAGSGIAIAATFFIGPEAEGINITVEGLEHVAEGHMVGGAKAIFGKKSIFSAGEDVKA